MKKDKKTPHPFFNEVAILFPVLMLVGFGLVMVHSASSTISMKTHGNYIYYVQKQAFFCVISLFAMFIAASFPYKIFKKLAYIILLTAIAMLVAVQISPFAFKAGGAYRWLKFGPIAFQPSELAKIGLIIFLAHSLEKKQDMIRTFSVGFFPHVILFGIIAVLIIIQPDLGTTVILAALTWIMMFVAGVKVLHLLSPVPFLIPAIYFLVFKVDYRWKRILTFLNPWDDPLNTGYQITHSLKAFGSGGIFGKGIGLGIQKLQYLPEAHTDFIFSVIGEELGLVGVIIIFILYSTIILRGTKIAKNSDDLFGTFVASGITASFGLQVIINIGVTMGVLPTKGLTLPFLSYGGTSLLISMTSMGILMNIGSYKTKK